MRRRVSTVLTVLALSGFARANDSADEADFLFQRGTELYQRGDYAGALERFLASNRLVPNRNVLFNIAYTYERLKRYPEAYQYFSLALEQEPDPEQAKRIAAARQAIARHVAVLDVVTSPPGATLFLDRKDLGPRGSSPKTFGLPPRASTLLVELPAYHPERVEVAQLRAGEVRRIELALRPILGHIRVESPAGALMRAVDVPERPSCLAPCVLSVAPGERRLDFELAGHRRASVTVRVRADATELVAPTLQAIDGKLVVRTDEPGAQIDVNNATLGFTPAVLSLPVGEHEVVISRTGFRPERRLVRVAASARTVLNLVLNEQEEVTAASRVTERVEEAPSSVTIVSRPELEAFRYPTIAEAVRGVPGAYVWDDRSYVTVGFRGLSLLGDYGNRVLVLLDGHPLNDNWLGSSYVGYEGRTDLGAIERIEVVRGPGSVVYGTSAFSGVINLVSRRTATRPVTTVGVTGQGDGVARLRVRADAPIGGAGGIWAHAAVARSSGRDFYFPELASAEPASSGGNARGVDGFESGTVEGQASWKAFSARWFWHSHDKAIPTASYVTLVGDDRARQRDSRAALELKLEPRLSETLSSLTRVHLNHYRFRGAYPRDPEEGGLQVDAFRGSWAGLEQRVEFEPSASLRVSAGGEIQSHFQADQVTVDETGTLLNEQGDRGHPFWVGAAYASVDATPIHALTLHGGARLDVYSTFGSSVNPRASAIIRPYRGGNLKLIAATAFRAPSIYELYYNDGGASQIPSPDLDPERIYSVELEMTHEFSPLITGSANVFGNYATNLVTRIGGGERSDPFYYENSDVPLGAVGLELGLRRDFRDGILIAASYGLIHARYLSDRGLVGFLRFERAPGGAQVENVPGHLASIKGIFPFYGRALRFASRLSLESGRSDRMNAPSEGGSQRRTSAVALWDVVISGHDSRTRFDWAFGVYNAFDYRYELPVSGELRQRTLAQSGRTVMLSADWSF